MAVSGFSVMEDIKLTVKTPNQRIEDIQISCEIGWTVQKLKEHLSSVYPTKPCKTIQRLIYAGKLLQDHLTLMDVLCKDSDSHTVHIVCSTANNLGDPSSVQERMTEKVAPVDVSTTDATAEPSSASQPAVDTSVRKRTTNTPSSSPQPAVGITNTANNNDLNDQWQQYVQSMQQYWNCYYQQQYAMAAAYHQHRINPQHQGSFAPWSPNATAPPFPMSFVPPTTSPAMPAVNPAQPDVQPAAAEQGATVPPPQLNQEDQRQEQAARPAEPAAANQNVPRVNAGGAMFDDDDDEEGAGRRKDWLDWVYTFLRCGVLLSIMYFYSTLSRLALVFLLGFIVYLYQNGWFSLPRRPAPPAPEVPQNANDAAEPEEGAQQANGQDATDNATTPSGDSTEQAPLAPTMFSLLWTFVSSFFTSLVPQRPQAFQQP